jgi:hypothetical protein
MSRALTFCLAVPTTLAFASTAGDQAPICGGVARAEPLGPAAFRAMLDGVAVGWNSNRAELAASLGGSP